MAQGKQKCIQNFGKKYPEARRVTGKPKYRQEYIIKMDLKQQDWRVWTAVFKMDYAPFNYLVFKNV